MCDAVYLRMLLSLSQRPTCFHHCVGFVLFLHCVSACWSNRAAVRLVELSAGWLASCSIAADVHHSRSAWAGMIAYCACYLFCMACVRLGMVLRRARAYKVDPSRCKALRQHQCPHRVMQGTLCCLEKNQSTRLTVRGRNQAGKNMHVSDLSNCRLTEDQLLVCTPGPDLPVCSSDKAMQPIATRLLSEPTSWNTSSETKSPKSRQCWLVKYFTGDWTAIGFSANLGTIHA